MLKIRIKSIEVETEQRKNAATGDTYKTRKQSALLIGEEEVKKFKLSLGEDGMAYEPGDYQLSSESITVSKYGSLELARPVLVKLAAAVK